MNRSATVLLQVFRQKYMVWLKVKKNDNIKYWFSHFHPNICSFHLTLKGVNILILFFFVSCSAAWMYMTLVYTTCMHVDYIINFKKFHRQVNKTGSTLGAASPCKRKKERSTNTIYIYERNACTHIFLFKTMHINGMCRCIMYIYLLCSSLAYSLFIFTLVSLHIVYIPYITKMGRCAIPKVHNNSIFGGKNPAQHECN